MELEEFLKNNGALVSFCRNVRKWSGLAQSMSIASINSFYWGETEEGSAYWSGLYDESYSKVHSNKSYVYYATHECLKPPKSFKAI